MGIAIDKILKIDKLFSTGNGKIKKCTMREFRKIKVYLYTICRAVYFYTESYVKIYI